MMKLRSLVVLSAFPALLYGAVSFATPSATPVDVAGAVAQLDTIDTTLLAIGGSLLVAAAVAVAIKWAKASIFG